MFLGRNVLVFTTLVQCAIQEETPVTTTDWKQYPEFRQAHEKDLSLDTLRQSIAQHKDQVLNKCSARGIP